METLGRTDRTNTSRLVELASRNSLLSKQAAATRLLELGYIKRSEYSNWFKQNQFWYQADKRSEIDNGPVITNIQHAKSIGEIGYLPVYLSHLAIDRKIVDSFDVEAALGISRKTQEKAFALARRRIEAVIDDAS